jgi:glycosyltransferase involved in cell wall biosynthesis
MKLRYIANARIPSEKAHPYQILKMCEAFAKNGISVNLVLPFRFQTNKNLKKTKDYWQHYGIKRKFRITKLPSFDLIWVDSYTMRFSLLRFLTQAISFAFFATLYSLFNRTDIYYTRDRFFTFFFGSLKFFHKRKIYYEAHKFEHLVSRLLRKGWVDGLIVITNKLKEIYMREGIPEEKILMVPDGVDLKMFGNACSKENARKELEIPLNKKVICYTGHLYDWKGAHVLAISMKNLSDDYVVYFIGGTNEDILKFRKFIRDNKILNAIIVGHVSPVVVSKYLAASDVLVLPNIRKYLSDYTSPLKLFEYMASKRPIVASDLPSIREILNEKNAVLVEPGNPQALAEAIKEVLEDEDFAVRIAEKAYKNVQQYTWEKRAEKILKFMKC